MAPLTFPQSRLHQRHDREPSILRNVFRNCRPVFLRFPAGTHRAQIQNRGRWTVQAREVLLGNINTARKQLNADTIKEMHQAFREGGRKAINTVMKNNPAMFLKLLVLLVPRELQVEHSAGIKAMTDEQIERTIEVIKEMIAKRDAAANAKVVEGWPSRPPCQRPASQCARPVRVTPAPPAPRRAEEDVVS